MNQEPRTHIDKKAKLADHGSHGSSAHTNGNDKHASTSAHHSTNGNGSTNGHDASQSHHLTSQGCMDLEEEYSAHNYHPLPIVFSRAKGARVWDPEGKEYIDCLSAYSAVNQVSGCCPPPL